MQSSWSLKEWNKLILEEKKKKKEEIYNMQLITSRLN